MSLFSLATQDKASWAVKLDGNLEEISGNGLTSSTCTVTGAATFQLSSATAGLGSYLFDQSPSQEMVYFTGTRSSSLSGFPVFEAVVKIENPPVLATVNDRVIVRGETTDGFGSRTLGVRIQANGTVSNPIFTAANTGTTTFSVTSNTNINDGQWHHLMAIESLSNNNTKIDLYVDGVLSATGTAGVDIGRAQPNNLRIGSRSTATTFGFYGLIDFAAVYSQGYLSTPTFDSTFVTAHYNNFLSTRDTYVIPSTLPYDTQIGSLNPKIWYKFNETAGTPVNSGSLSTTSTFTDLLQNEQTDVNGRAVYFNGSSSNIILPAHPAFSLFDDRSFTIETWIKASQTDVSSIYQPILFHAVGGASSRSISLELAGSARSGTPGKVVWSALNGTGNVTTLISATRVDDNNWHHIVAVHNTTSMKIYIDGQLSISGTPLGSSNFDIDIQTNKKVIGQAFGANGTNYKGRMDEFAVYDRELTASEILFNYNAGAAVVFADQSGNASALITDVTIITDGIHNAAPMTADSLFVNTQPSTVDFPKMLEAYLSEFSLEQWYKFDNPGIVTNYGTGGIVGSSMNYNGTISNVMHGGIQGSGALKATNGPAYLVQAFGANEPYSTEVTDHEFALGFWIKADTNYNNRNIFRYYNAFDAQNHYYDAFIGSGGTITFRSKGTQEANVTYATAIDDNAWHFVYVEASAANNLIRISVDNSAFSTATTVAANRPTGMNAFTLGNTSTSTNGELLLSHYFVGAYGLMDSTARGNVLTYEDTVIQGSARMPEPVVKFSNKFNDLVASYNPKIEFRLDEASGLPFNFGQTGISTAKVGTNVTYSEPTQNRFAYKFTNADTYFSGDYSYSSGTFSTGNKQTMLAVFKTSTARAYEQIIGSMGMFGFLGAGITLAITTSGHLTARVNRGFGPTDTEAVNYNTNVCDGAWHFAAVVRDGSNLTLYVDGKQRAQKTNCVITLSDTATWGISAEAKFNSQGAAAKDLWIDEFAVLADEFSAQEVFELWQSLNIDGAMIANNATLPMPTNIAGTGYIDTPALMTASAEFVESTQTDEINLFSDSLNAHSTFMHPNYVATSVVDANYGAVAMIADALFHDPQFQIGEFVGADHMDASALMVHPLSTGGGRITVSTAVGGPAELVMPGIVTIKGAQHFAEPMRSRAIFPLPPAYVQLSDDNWYLRLLQGHADKKIEAVQAQLSNLPNQSTTDVVKGGFLSFFDDVLLDITPTTAINSINSEIPAHYFDRPGTYRYDSNGNLYPLDTTKAVARASAPRASITPTPMASVGYFDNQERRALRIENVEFVLPGTSINHSERPYNLEFSFKTTKANQIIAYGQWNSFLYYGRRIGVIGLFDGKIYLADDAYKVWSGTGSASLGDSRRNIAASAPHPKNFTNEYYVPHLLGRKRIDDGQWHHVVIQKGWTDNRTQIWIDGALDRQIGVLNPELGSGPNLIKGLDGTNSIRPYIIGFNSTDPNLYSDFQTSAWNFYPGRFIEERDLSLNYSAFSKWEPIKPEPMLATINLTDNTKAKGNRPRAIMLYWWETNPNGSLQHKTFDGEELYNLDTDTFAQLKTQYNDKEPVQKYYGWDIFPIDILGRYRSPLTKEDVIVSAGYRDPVTGAPRYLDIINDLDLSTIDAIFFRNYPDETAELDEFARDEIADTYFGLTERTLYENFVKSLRSVLDTGINLYITNHTLAKDLGIIRDVEVVYDLIDQDTAQFNSYPQEQAPVPLDNVSYEVGGPSNFKGWYDTYKNNYLKVINTVPGITDQYGIIRNAIQMYNPSAEEWNQPFRSFASYTQKQNLNVGDTFVISYAPYTPFSAFGNTSRMSIEGYYATHKDNVLAGIPITAFADTYRKNSVETENPYKDYVTSIALPTGTILNGRPIKSRVFVNFTERINGSFEEGSVELIQDEWIDIAFQVGRITAAQRDAYKAAPYNLDRRLEAAIAAGNQTQINNINKLKYWDMNGMNMGSSSQLVQGTISDQSASTGGGSGTSATAVTSNRGTIAPQPDNADARGSWGGGIWFKFQFFWQYPMLRIPVSSMLTRGFVWLANRIVDDGTVNRTNVTTASATMVMPVVVGDKDRTVYAQAALSNANLIHAQGYALTNVSNSTLPFLVEAKFGEFVKNIRPDVMAAEARFRSDILTTAVETDQVVVYVYHVDPIVYLREEVIK